MPTTAHYPQKHRGLAAWCIEDHAPPAAIAAALHLFHFAPVIALHYRHGVTLVPSLRSGYRSPAYELAHGRDGRSLHTFPPGTWGAVDLTAPGAPSILHHLDAIAAHGPWSRICVYPAHNFVHVDYGRARAFGSGPRQLFECSSPSAPWVFRSNLSPLPSPWH